MTDLLADLLYSFGLLDVTVMTMEKARSAWAGKLGPMHTDTAQLETKFADGEPALIVRCLQNSPGRVRETTEDDLKLLADDPRGVTSNVKFLELPPDEFHYFSAFRTGIADLTKDLPAFFYGMTLVHAWGMFEHYLGSLLLRILLNRPEMLGRVKQVTLGDILDHASKESLLATVATREVRNLFYQPAREWLKALRGRYGLKGLTRQHDNDLIETALVRNCVVHNRGLADDRLEKESAGRCTQGTQIFISSESVSTAANLLRKFATAIDEEAMRVHFPAPGAR